MFANQTIPPFSSMPTPKEPPLIKVTGEGTVTVSPDRSIIILGTISENQNLQAAQTANAEAISRIIQSLVNLGIPYEQIQTYRYQIEMMYEYPEGKQTFLGYKVTHLLQVTINQIEQTGLVVDTAVQNGANTVSSIRFTVRNPEIHYLQALTMAVKNSQLKAATIAQGLGVRYNPIPQLVQETTLAPEPVPFPAETFLARISTPVLPGELQIRASVRADYMYSF